ncbi:hypothetical protein OUZ56_011607 [Daphnia magna]|uniref:Uncharacterized protein n=1 Tax=Daphnia magna TaxID=35525 RepID=A0ABQ9Z0L8_9CRUS|nr:hypothetical protein OUZ56_011607 [Daphnia magna]
MPLDRTKKAQPYEIIGIDYFGPMYVLEEVILIEKDKEGDDVEKTRIGKETARGLQTIYPLEIQHDVDIPVDVTEVGPREAEAGQKEGNTSAPKKNPNRKKKKESPMKTRDSGGEDVADHELQPDGQITSAVACFRGHSLRFDLATARGPWYCFRLVGLKQCRVFCTALSGLTEVTCARVLLFEVMNWILVLLRSSQVTSLARQFVLTAGQAWESGGGRDP